MGAILKEGDETKGIFNSGEKIVYGPTLKHRLHLADIVKIEPDERGTEVYVLRRDGKTERHPLNGGDITAITLRGIILKSRITIEGRNEITAFSEPIEDWWK